MISKKAEEFTVAFMLPIQATKRYQFIWQGRCGPIEPDFAWSWLANPERGLDKRRDTGSNRLTWTLPFVSNSSWHKTLRKDACPPQVAPLVTVWSAQKRTWVAFLAALSNADNMDGWSTV